MNLFKKLFNKNKKEKENTVSSSQRTDDITVTFKNNGEVPIPDDKWIHFVA